MREEKDNTEREVIREKREEGRWEVCSLKNHKGQAAKVSLARTRIKAKLGEAK